MNFLNVGPWEMMVIVMIAILLIGPKKMAEVVQTIGRVTRQMRDLSGEFVRAMRSEIQTTEAGVQSIVDEAIKGEPGAGGDLSGELKAAKTETDQTLESLFQGELGLSSIRSDLEAASRETRDLMRSVLNDIAAVAGGGDETPPAAPEPDDEHPQPGEASQPDGTSLPDDQPHVLRSSATSAESPAAAPDETSDQPTTSEASEA